MICPQCKARLRAITYEGIEIETCDACGGEWHDADELGKIVRLREVRFSQRECRAMAAVQPLRGVKIEEKDRDLACPKCGATTDAIHYGGDSGIILDRCTGCRGVWLEAGELEKVQMLVEGWDDGLPEDMEQFGAKLHQVAAEIDRKDDVEVSRLPLVGRFINALVNKVLDVTT